MSESATLVTRFLYGVILTSVLVTGILATTAAKPHQAEAAGMMADAQCVPAVEVCGCGMVKGPKGCIPGLNKWMCPCFDETNGFVTPGICVANFKCKAEGQPGQPPMLPMPPMPPPPPPSSDDPCMAGWAGGSFSGQNTSATTSTSTADRASSTCPGGGTGYEFPQPTFPAYDPFAGAGSTGTGGTNFDITSGTGNNAVSSLLDGTNTTGGGTNSGGSVVPGSTTTAVKPVFGSVDGISGDVRLQGTAVSLLVSNRDASRGTQVSGMFGVTVVSGITASTVFKTMCGLRPWSSSYLSFIVPSAYFDSLCTARGFALGAKITGTSAGTTAKTTPPPAPVAAAKPPPPPPPPAYLGPLRAEIWATPPSVAVGQRTSIFWEAKGVSTCSITSNDGSFSGSSISGHASTQPLTKNTTFSISCMSATSTVSNQVVVTVQ